MSYLSTSDTALLKDPSHKTKLYLSIYNPRTIFSAQVNDSNISREARTITYDNSIGDYSQVYANMDMIIGSTPGASDIGKIRVKSITSPLGASQILVAENSDIQWANNQYLTILNYISVNAIYPRIVVTGTNTYFYKDYDIPYTTQNSVLGTFVCAGPHRGALLKNGQSTQLYWSSSGTLNLLGDNINFQWFFEGGNPTGSLLRDPGYISYSTAGDYKTVLTVSGTSGEVDTTMRFVSIKNDPNFSSTNVPIINWELMEFNGSRKEGGYTGKIRVRDLNAKGIQNNALIVLFSDDWYGTTNKSIGGNSENCSSIFFTGYIVADTIYYNYQDAYIEFGISSIGGQMKDAVGFSISVQDQVTPKTWYEILDMTVPKALYHYMRWHSTLLSISDFRYTGPQYSFQYMDTDRDSLYDALNKFLDSAIIGELVSDRQGSIWAELSSAGTTNARTAFNTNMQIDKTDWINTPQLVEVQYNPIGYVTMGGVAYSGQRTGTFSAYLACAPGVSPSYRGKVEPEKEGLILLSQSELNQLVGNWFADTNTTYPQLTMELHGNYRNLDIAPLEITGITILPSDTPRGITLNQEPFHNVSMEWKYDGMSQNLHTSKFELSQLQNGIPGDTILIPPVSAINVPIISIPLPPVLPPTSILPLTPGLTANIMGLVHSYGPVYTTSAIGSLLWNPMIVGLTSPTTVITIELSATGRCYCLIPFDSVWYAPYFGATWTKIFDTTMVGNPEGLGFWSPQVFGFGVNPQADDELIIVAGGASGPFNWVMYNWYGSSAGVSLQTPTHWNINNSSPSSMPSYRIKWNNGSWIISWSTGGVGHGITEAIISENGTSVTNEQTLSPLANDVNLTQMRSSTAPTTDLIMGQTVAEISQDAGITWYPLTGSHPAISNGAYYEQAATNPNGQRVVLSTISGSWGSLNGGLTWSRMSLSGSASSTQLCWWNLKDDVNYLFSEVGKVRYTPDFGNNIADLTGNLPIILSGTTFQISALRNWG